MKKAPGFRRAGKIQRLGRGASGVWVSGNRRNATPAETRSRALRSRDKGFEKFLFDTNVVSEIRHPQGDEAVKARFRTIDSTELLTSAVVFGELCKGVEALPPGKIKVGLQNWLEQFETEFGDRILPFDRSVAALWGEIVAKASRQGRRGGVSDGQIAATAAYHGLTVISRNVSDFEPTGVSVWNIWESNRP